MNPQDLFLTYIVNFPVLANAAFQGAIQINQGGDFLCRYLIATSTSTFNIKFADGGSSLFFMNDFVNNGSIFGTGQLPLPMRPPYRFPKNGTIFIQGNDTSGAGNTIQLCFQGYQIYGPGSQSGEGSSSQQGVNGYRY